MDFVGLYPPELVEEIFYFLSIDDLVSVSRVSVSWYIASNSSRLWRAVIKHSFSRDRFIKLSDLDKFNGISSNYDSDHSFNVEKPSTSRLPPMNPWKLSLFKHNFLQSRFSCGEKPRLKSGSSMLQRIRRLKVCLVNRFKFIPAKRRIAIDDGMEILHLNVTFPSKSVQDGLYLPVLGRKRGETNRVLYLMQLDGVLKDTKDGVLKQLLSTEAKISYACIDRHGIGWVENEKVYYLPFVENFWLNFNSSQIKNLGSVCLESDAPILNSRCLITMDTNHFAVGAKFGHVRIWDRETFKLKITITPEASIKSFNFNNGHFYLALCRYGAHNYNYVQIYDVKQDRLISMLHVESPIERIVFGVEYYAIVSDNLICVHEINTNKVVLNLTVRNTHSDNIGGWFVNNFFLYKQEGYPKTLNLDDWNIQCRCRYITKRYMTGPFSYFNIVNYHSAVVDRFLLVYNSFLVHVWDWMDGRELQHIKMPVNCKQFHLNEIRLMSVGERSVDVVDFW